MSMDYPSDYEEKMKIGIEEIADELNTEVLKLLIEYLKDGKKDKKNAEWLLRVNAEWLLDLRKAVELSKGKNESIKETRGEL